jgi:hypothetical protein
LDAYYEEGSRRHERELNWAGDGLQVWFQILYQAHQMREHETLILDEPEVYLHPDLQRRLVRLLDSLDRQIILATHSSEIVTEVEPSSVVLIDRATRRGRRVKDDTTMSGISAVIGSQFNIRLAKALKSKVALFVEGDDIRLLRKTAKTLGCSSIANEQGVVVLELRGFSGHLHVDAFNWLCKDLLAGSVAPYVVLDRDYRSDNEVRAIEQKLASAGIAGHVWRRKELESYYLTPATLARELSVAVEQAIKLLTDASAVLKTHVFSRLASSQSEYFRGAGTNLVTVIDQMQPSFEANWRDLSYRLSVCPAKDLLSAVNRLSQLGGGKTISASKLAVAQREDEILDEMADLLRRVEQMLDVP